MQQFATLAAQSQPVEFSEGDTYDFTRCVRPDGSAYGTKGKCRKGTEGAKAIEKAAPKAAPKVKKTATPAPAPANVESKKPASGVDKPQKPKEGNPVSKLKEKIKETVQKAKDLAEGKKADPVSETASEEYARLLKKKMDLVAKGDIKSALKVSPDLNAALAKVKAEQAKTVSPQKSTQDEDKKGLEEADRVRDARQAEAKLTPKQKKSISDYTSANGDPDNPRRSYSDVNGCLRSPPTCMDKKASAAYAKEMDAAIAKLPKNDEGHEFYRGVDARSGAAAQLYKQLQTVQPGMRMRDPGFGSYSSDKNVTEDFTMGKGKPSILFVSRNSNLTPINTFSQIPEEREALMPRGIEQTVRKVTKNGNTLIVEID